jgi:apolipoprotein D and lipocalin family protein
MKQLTISLILLILCSCSAKPDLPPTIDNFAAERYLGQWYEIARYENWFEKDLDNTSAFYSQKKDGRVEVLNKGYNPKKDKWKEANGFARLNRAPNKGLLRVTFMWPFFADYRIIHIDGNYEHAIVGSNTFKYLWILSRSPSISEDKKSELLEILKGYNYDVSKLIYPNQDKNKF